MQQFFQALVDRLYLLIALLSGHLQVGQLFFFVIGELHVHRHPIDPMRIRNGRRHHRLIAAPAAVDIIIGVLSRKDFMAIGMIGKRPIQTQHGASPSLMRWGDYLAVSAHQRIDLPARFKH